MILSFFTGQQYIEKNFCKDTIPGLRKSAIMRRHTIRDGKSVSSPGHLMQGGIVNP